MTTDIKGSEEIFPLQKWSVMIPTYNTGRFLEQTLRSVLEQDPGPDIMQIEVIDDCSTSDDPEEIVGRVGGDRVSFFRKEKNEGIAKNFNSCISRSKGHLLHILHGDDYVLPGFYKEIQSVAERNQDVNGFFSKSFVVNEKGETEVMSAEIEGLLTPTNIIPKELMYYNEVKTPGVVVRKGFYDKYGGFIEGLPHIADWEMWTRCIAMGKGIFVNKPLTCYRSYPGNGSGRDARSGDNIREKIKMASYLIGRCSSFDEQIYIEHVAESAKLQFKYFSRNGDKQSARNNFLLWKELAGARGFQDKIALTYYALLKIW
jgi:glycosyltransferase involved in cell wall biosynthesis